MSEFYLITPLQGLSDFIFLNGPLSHFDDTSTFGAHLTTAIKYIF
jgi:hypothetical protein